MLTQNNIFFKVFLHIYYRDDDNYIQDLKYFRIFRYKLQIYIL